MHPYSNQEKIRETYQGTQGPFIHPAVQVVGYVQPLAYDWSTDLIFSPTQMIGYLEIKPYSPFHMLFKSLNLRIPSATNQTDFCGYVRIFKSVEVDNAPKYRTNHAITPQLGNLPRPAPTAFRNNP